MSWWKNVWKVIKYIPEIVALVESIKAKKKKDGG